MKPQRKLPVLLQQVACEMTLDQQNVNLLMADRSTAPAPIGGKIDEKNKENRSQRIEPPNTHMECSELLKHETDDLYRSTNYSKETLDSEIISPKRSSSTLQDNEDSELSEAKKPRVNVVHGKRCLIDFVMVTIISIGY